MFKVKNFVGIVFVVFTTMVLAAGIYAESGKININTASEKELEALDKIGPEIAKRIVEYRKAKGPFKKPEDIIEVKGIGEKIYQLNKDRIIVADPAPTPAAPSDKKADEKGKKQ